MNFLVLVGFMGVFMFFNIDIVENIYCYILEYFCFGEIGYLDVSGYLFLIVIYLISGEIVVYNEEVVMDIMKVKIVVGLNIYDYGVIFVNDFVILIREDRKVQENCFIIYKVRFFFNVLREWSRGSLKCEIWIKEEWIFMSVKEE